MCQKYPSVLIHPIINNLASPHQGRKSRRPPAVLYLPPQSANAIAVACPPARVISCFDVLWFLKRVISTHCAPHGWFGWPFTSESPQASTPQCPSELVAWSHSTSQHRGALGAGWKATYHSLCSNSTKHVSGKPPLSHWDMLSPDSIASNGLG